MKRRSCLGLLAALTTAPALMVAGFIGWSGIEARQAFNNGALDQPVWCVDRKPARDEVMGTVKDHTRIRGLAVQVAKFEGLFENYSLFRSVRTVGWQVAIDIFWSKSDRIIMFDAMRSRMKLCHSMHGAAAP